MSGLGRRVPPDFRHVERYPVRALGAQAPKNVPVVLGINWYTAFDQPERQANGRYIIGKDAQRLGSVRGGHCVCLAPNAVLDRLSWYGWYNQVAEGCCVGEGSSRASSLDNRKEYQPWWLYRRAQQRGGIPASEEGANVRDALETLRVEGHVKRRGSEPQYLGADGDARLLGRQGDRAEGIAVYRWATTVDDVLRALGTPTLDHVEILNSWGHDYPRRVTLPAATLERLLQEQGEAGIITDR
jgi:hypothetical protein